MSYLDWDNRQLFALARERRREANAARVAVQPPTVRYSVRDFPPPCADPHVAPCPLRGSRPAYRYRKPGNGLHGLVPASVFLTLWELQDGCCYLCAKPFVEDDWATRDHVVPRSKGGEDGGNTLLACGACNTWKADSDPTPCELLYLAGVNLRFMSVFNLVSAEGGFHPRPPIAAATAAR